MDRRIPFLLLFLIPLFMPAQMTPLPYQQIPDAPEDFGPGSMLSRMIDGLGFRYYWATEGLRIEDWDYRPSEDARSSRETIVHIYDLSTAILAASEQQPIERGMEPDYSLETLRKKTLDNFSAASSNFRG